MTEGRSGSDLADEVVRARNALVRVAQRCSETVWNATPFPADPRTVGVVIDHVAHAYTYLGRWVSELLDGGRVNVDAGIVDALNEQHAQSRAGVTRGEAIDQLFASGDAFAELIRPLEDDDLELAGGRVRRFAEIARRHADDHRADIEAALLRDH